MSKRDNPMNWLMGLLFIDSSVGDKTLPDSTTDYVQKLWDYINALEQINIELVDVIRKCVSQLEKFEDSPPDPANWQRILALFREALKASEKSVEKNMTLTEH